MYKLNFSKNFKNDVKSSVNYIKNTLQAPMASEKLKDEIRKAYKKIKQNPYMCPIVPNSYLANMGFRFTKVKNYMLFYIIEVNEINIIRFSYGRRDWINIIKETNIIED
jgi:plasmid stabilization system protein ParE